MRGANQAALQVIGRLVELQSFLEMSITPCDAALKNNGHNFDDIRRQLDDLCAEIEDIHQKARKIHLELIGRISEPLDQAKANVGSGLKA
jgi:hypothetical protein